MNRGNLRPKTRPERILGPTRHYVCLVGGGYPRVLETDTKDLSASCFWALTPHVRGNQVFAGYESLGARSITARTVKSNADRRFGYGDHLPQRGDGSPLRPAGRALAPARQHKYDHVHDEHGDESEQNHE